MRKSLARLFFLSLMVASCQYNSDVKMKELQNLHGSWYCEEIQQREVWSSYHDTLLSGVSFGLRDGQTLVLEKLGIQQHGSRIIYQATVLEQNKGATINFQLNPFVDSLFSFENLEHDFPQKIQYRFINADELEVGVLNAADEGKHFRFTRESNSLVSDSLAGRPH